MPVTVYDNTDNEVNILIVAPESWRANINDSLPGQNCKYIWSSNVFDALATIVSTKALPRPFVVIILIDTLNSDEMNFFKYICHYPNIISIGITAVAGRRKLDQAQLLGASQTGSVMELPEILQKCLSLNPPELDKPDITIDNQSENRSVAIERRDPKTLPEPDDVALEINNFNIQKLVSNNELDSLLGD